MRRGPRTAFALFAATACAACGMVLGLDDVSYDTVNDAGGVETSTTDGSLADAGADAAPQPDAPLPAPDALVDARSDAGPDGGCERDGQVQASGYCIDATEVTVGEYDAFIASLVGGLYSPQPTACLWKKSQSQLGNTTNLSLPVSNVDWCDAYAFCAWAGKRLCGRIGGGASAAPDNPFIDEWFAACSHDGTNLYPYGMTYDASACNTRLPDAAATSVVPVRSRPGCQGGYPGLFDMSGNVWEWEDSCDAGALGKDASVDECVVRGGSFVNADAPSQACAAHNEPAYARSLRNNNIGFRCCAP